MLIHQPDSFLNQVMVALDHTLENDIGPIPMKIHTLVDLSASVQTHQRTKS